MQKVSLIECLTHIKSVTIFVLLAFLVITLMAMLIAGGFFAGKSYVYEILMKDSIECKITSDALSIEENHVN